MKLIFLKTSLLLIIFTACAAYSFAEEKRQQPVLILSDNRTEFSVLKSLFDSGFFAGNNYNIQYVPIEAGSGKKDLSDNFFLTSGLKDAENVEYASFNFFLSDSLKQNLKITWDIPRQDPSRQQQSIRNMIDFAYNVYFSSVPDALINTAGLSNAIEKLDVNYSEVNITGITGYDINIHTGFSPTHRFVRALSELTLLAGVGMANYWINKDANMEDWRYKYRWKDVWPRFRDGWSYDSNAFRTNTIYHIYAGAIYYQIGRSNDYGILASTAWAFAGSLIWEYIGEWREQTSANDIYITGIGGALAGEALRQSGIYIEQCLPNSVYGTVLSFLLDPMRIINRALDRCFDGHYKVSIVFMNPAVQAIIEKNKKN
jgi:hypothetical protein